MYAESFVRLLFDFKVLTMKTIVELKVFLNIDNSTCMRLAYILFIFV